MNKKICAMLAVVLMGTTLFSGCTSDKNNTSDKLDSNASGTLLTDKPAELSIFNLDGFADIKFEDRAIQQEAARLTGVTVKQYNSSNVSTIQEAFSLMMSTGDLPDVVLYASKEDINKYGMEGAFEPLNDLIEKYAPNYKKMLDAHPDLKKAITADDGNIYGLMDYGDYAPSMGWIIRQDWLDKLGLETPDTLDEFYNVLKAFREQDPNGNGKKDEVPYFHRLNGNNEAMSSLLPFWNARPDWYVVDGKVHYGPYEEEIITAYSNISKWYEEGLIDKEIFTRGANARNVLFDNNTGGCTHDWFPSTTEFNNKMIDKYPEFNLQVILPPAGKEIVIRGGVKTGTIAAISTMCENKELAMKWIDFWFSEEGMLLYNYGVEGEHFTMVDGKPKYTDTVLNSEKGVLGYLYEQGAHTGMLSHEDISYELQYMPEAGVKGMEMYSERDDVYSNDWLPTLNYTTEEEKEFSRIMTDIKTYVTEQQQKWVLGAEDLVKNKDKYFEGLKNMGMEKAIKIQQAAYDRVAE